MSFEEEEHVAAITIIDYEDNKTTLVISYGYAHNNSREGSCCNVI